MIENNQKELWGVPDWRDANAYRSVGTTSDRWAWEFLRRNPVFREWWLQKIEPHFSRPYRFDRRSDAPLFEECRKLFGVLTLEDPRTSNFNVSLEAVALKVQPNGPAGPVTFCLDRNEVACVFNLTAPLDPQLANVKDWLEGQKQHLKDEGEIDDRDDPRPRVEKFTTYLRILDAIDAGAERAEVAAAVHGDKPNFKPDYKGNDAVRKDQAAAIKLRDHGYRYFSDAISKT